ncbi:hypothetical protein HII13_002761 [Brettanomyces bruxellensis]|uniref:DEBR0S1_00562g1_1 n=1 Tax=Dekkera bruxellensis TaxID=5007 RepID=A0A3F2XZF5_DEKBR|nr:hypothetical protein HII13_002761 [Brettanomyces bruxellensis]VUG15807.1 DEBR0S1_00562g1_1 [Brettanomyces bruxellensis]
MLDALPLDQYKTNYRDIIHDQPLEYGNMKGLVLDKDRFRRDFDDFDVLLRKNVPAKYKGYFNPPGNAKISTDNLDRSMLDEQIMDDDDTEDIEYRRSSPSKMTYKLSPIKKRSHKKIPSISIKDSEDLKAPEADIFHISKKEAKRPLQQLKTTDGLDSLVEQTYRYIDENLRGDTQLSNLVSDLVQRLRSLERKELIREQQENEISVEEKDNSNLDQSGRSQQEWVELLKVFQQKLAKYKSKNLSLRLEIEGLEDKVRSLKQSNNNNSDEFEDSDEEYIQLQTKLGRARKDLALMKNELREVKLEKSEMEVELERLTSKVSVKKTELEELMSRLNTKDKELENTLAKVAQQKDMLDELEKSVEHGPKQEEQNNDDESRKTVETDIEEFKDDPELKKLNEEMESLKEKRTMIIEKRRKEREEASRATQQREQSKVAGPVININFPPEFSDRIASKVTDAILTRDMQRKEEENAKEAEKIREEKKKTPKLKEETTSKEYALPHLSSPINLGKDCPACGEEIYGKEFVPRKRTTRPYSADDDIRKYGFRGSARTWENGNSLRSNDSLYKQSTYGAVW